ncbi:hypothetical protein I7I50_04553 [Histoplasma capsulatum G186AR]|uniref:Uncharacterized protein n=1 Tax=Ajellomyces capsulatus TaxID=5037 RepID=A0A8H8CZ33_AJECA|nr:hypothetical protein I7I52_05462 [Histoplasma capsulatum]QSS75425.1 hypothetical protein I7I50_04553 [Histoplasma capsulatum G186AR]
MLPTESEIKCSDDAICSFHCGQFLMKLAQNTFEVIEIYPRRSWGWAVIGTYMDGLAFRVLTMFGD